MFVIKSGFKTDKNKHYALLLTLAMIVFDIHSELISKKSNNRTTLLGSFSQEFKSNISIKP